MSERSITRYFPFMRVKITGQTVHGEHPDSALIYLAPDLRFQPLCHACQSPAAKVHSKGHLRHIRDLNMGAAEVWLQVDYRKVCCETCGRAKVEHLSFANASQRVTHRLAQYIHGLCKVMTVKDVALHLDLDPKTVKAIDKAFLQEHFGTTDCRKLRVLAIDEIALRKGHNYMTVVMDYLSGRIVWMGDGRTEETLNGFFEEMTEPQKEAVEAVAMDMWQAYINCVNRHCPNAKIVFDFFHVVQAFGRVIDKVRRAEYLKAGAEDRKVLKGSRYLLLKNEENITRNEQTRLQAVLALNATLSTLYVLKDQLKLLYYYSDRGRVKTAMEDWCRMAEPIEHPVVKTFITRLRTFGYGILNHADYPIGTSALEGANNKIKVIKRKAYGFHDSQYFALKVKQAFETHETNQLFGS
jgi:transposase